MNAKIVTIDLDTRSYDIYIGSGLLYRMADFVPVDMEGRNAFIITDRNVEPFATTIKDVMEQDGAAKVEILALPGGEPTKSFSQVESVCSWLLERGVARDSVIFAVGGGVIGDLAGFCAAIVMRGVSYVQVPTTLLAQVDSSVGGKTGINTAQGKNLVGSFYQPVAVIADLETLRGLPRREILAGYAEIVKYGLINDADFFAWLEKHGRDVCDIDENAMAYAIEVSTRSKATIVQADEKERGQRALLNLGHTFGHALEAAAGYDGRLLHGEAVAIGIVMAFDLSSRMDLCSREEYERVEKHFLDIGLPTRASFVEPRLNTSVDALMEIMGRDKKVAGGKTRFILANGIGEAFVSEDAPDNLVREVLRDSLAGGDGDQTMQSMKGAFRQKGIRGLWRSAFSSQS